MAGETDDQAAQSEGGRALQVANWLMTKAADGFGPISGAVSLAQEYQEHASCHTADERVAALIRWEGTKNFTSGFVTGLGGVVTMPITIPAALGSSWVLQARLAMAIAHLYGYDIRKDQVRTMALLAVVGDTLKEPIKVAGAEIGKRAVQNAIKQMPRAMLKEVNRAVGFRLITKAGQTGIINLTKMVPVIGGAIGGTVDAAMCTAVGKAAKSIFGPAVAGSA